MGTPSVTAEYNSTCTLIVEQDHLSKSTSEQDGSKTTNIFHLIYWNGYATVVDCEGCTDGTNVVPVWGNELEGAPTRLVRRVEINPVQNETRCIFQQRSEYSDSQTTPANPLLARPLVTWSVGDSKETPYFLDNNISGFKANGDATTPPAGPQPTLNSCGERFQEFLTRETGAISATYIVNVPLTGTAPGYNGSTVSAYDPQVAINYCLGGVNQSTPAVNTDTFNFDGFPIQIGQARMAEYTCSPIQVQNGVNFRTVTFKVLFKSTWLDIIEDRGFNTLVLIEGMANESLQPIPNATGGQTQTPWPLDGHGHAKPNVTDAPALLCFVPYRQLPFAPLAFH